MLKNANSNAETDSSSKAKWSFLQQATSTNSTRYAAS